VLVILSRTLGLLLTARGSTGRGSNAFMYTLLVATDFSECSRIALREAFDVAARRAPAELILLHVIDEPAEPTDPLAESEKIASGLLLEATMARAEAPVPDSVRLHCHVTRGAPAERIAAEALAHACALIVVGTHGRTGLRRFVLGSVAESVARLAHCSVLTVKAPSPA
jgi:nucleotide-binding universal stress UspA family protein